MKKLRLLFTQDCNRNCKGCCNKEWNLNNLPSVDSFDYNEILITGGEPLLYPERLIGYIKAIRAISTAKIYVYTAMTVVEKTFKPFYDILKYVDGITLTLHNQKDSNNFNHVLYSMQFDEWTQSHIQDKSLRLNVFKGVTVSTIFDNALSMWKIKYDMEWIKNCPLPKDEEFKRI